MKITLLILIIIPAILFIFNEELEYMWLIDNLQNLLFFFNIYYISIFIYLIIKKEYKLNIILIISFLFFVTTSTNKNKTYKGTSIPLSFSTFQYNMFYNSYTIKDTLKIIEKEDPDILVFQELTIEMGVDIYNELNGKYKYTIGIKPMEGFPSQQLLMSKFPILKSNIVEFSKRKYRYITGTIKIKNRELFFYIMHPPSPKNKSNWEIRNKLLKTANNTIISQSKPYILIGDLNISYSSNQFNKIFKKKYYNYNTLEKGYTWSRFCIPYINQCIFSSEIDHSLTSKNIFLETKKVYLENKKSDHFPIYSKFNMYY